MKNYEQTTERVSQNIIVSYTLHLMDKKPA